MNFLGLFATKNDETFDIVDRPIIGSSVGENGTLQLTEDEVGDIRLILFSHLCRDAPIEKIDRLFKIYINNINESNKSEMITDLFLILFEKRDCRGGEGEKMLFQQLYHLTYKVFPRIANVVMKLIPEYGSWKDLWNNTILTEDDRREEMFTICSERLLEDSVGEHPSLCAKWCPTERSMDYKKYHKYMNDFICKIYPDSTTPQKDYRKLLTTLREEINVTERLMCSGHYGDIDPNKVPSICTNKFRKAFLNISLDDTKEIDVERGNRFPDDEDRVLCRKRWLANIKSGKIKGAQLDPYTLVNSLQSSNDADEIALINEQYKKLLEKTKEQIKKAVDNGYEPMNNIIPMVDLSPSMNGKPKTAAIGLGILLSELCDPRFGNTLISFDSNCHIVKLDPRLSFSERVDVIRRLPEGCSTNFHLAMTRLCKIIRDKNLTQSELPSICILTDEQMNAAFQYGYSSTVDENIKKMFEELGNEMHGIPFTRPRTVHWNLRANTSGYPVKAMENNVQAITGYSASLLDLILTGKPEPNPFETMKRKLDSTRYDPVRELVSPMARDVNLTTIDIARLP